MTLWNSRKCTVQESIGDDFFRIKILIPPAPYNNRITSFYATTPSRAQLSFHSFVYYRRYLGRLNENPSSTLINTNLRIYDRSTGKARDNYVAFFDVQSRLYATNNISTIALDGYLITQSSLILNDCARAQALWWYTMRAWRYDRNK